MEDALPDADGEDAFSASCADGSSLGIDGVEGLAVPSLNDAFAAEAIFASDDDAASAAACCACVSRDGAGNPSVLIATAFGAAALGPDVAVASLADELASAQAETSNVIVIVTSTAPGKYRAYLPGLATRRDRTSNATVQSARQPSPIDQEAIASTSRRSVSDTRPSTISTP